MISRAGSVVPTGRFYHQEDLRLGELAPPVGPVNRCRPDRRELWMSPAALGAEPPLDAAGLELVLVESKLR